MEENPQRLPPIPLFPCPYSMIDENYIRRVQLKTLTGKSAVLHDVPKFLMVDESLMAQIHEREGIPVDQQHLISPGPTPTSKHRRMFEDDLVCWFLTEEDTVIYLVVRLRGVAHTKQSGPSRRPKHVLRSLNNTEVRRRRLMEDRERRRLMEDRKRKWTLISSPSYPPSYWHSYIKDNRRLSSSHHHNRFFHENNSVLVSLPDDLVFPVLLLLAALCHPDSNSDLTDLYQFIRSGTSSLVQNILH
jgi:hypothetical protein